MSSTELCYRQGLSTLTLPRTLGRNIDCPATNYYKLAVNANHRNEELLILTLTLIPTVCFYTTLYKK